LSNFIIVEKEFILLLSKMSLLLSKKN